MRRSAVLATLVFLSACGGGGGGAPPPAGPNQTPSFTSPPAASVAENRTDVYQATATDPDGNAFSFTISGGADAARFTISAAGLLRFAVAPDFELPTDADGNNVYLVEISVSDGQAARTLAVEITVTNDREGIAVRRVAGGFTQPLYVAPIPGDTRVFVLEKGGSIFLLDPAAGIRTLFLSAAERLNPAGAGIFDNISTDGERGLLGLAALPDYQATGRFVLYVTNADGDIEIRLCRRDAGGLGSARLCQVLFTIEHSQFNNHNGGWMGFGPDGNLYIATGDGGDAGDPQNNAQNTNSLLGKILRIVINPDPFAGASPVFYFPAPGNPFLGGGGAREVFAYGLRNPFRASFSGDALLIGDVGQDAVEEIDLLRTTTPGLNFGWRFREGTRPFAGTAPAGLTDPVSEYLHGSGPRQGNSIIGGYVYRGPALSLRGRYVFADFVSRNLWSVPADQLVQGQVLPSSRYERRNDDFTPDAGAINQPVSFGEDAAGNLYIVDFDGEIFLVGGS
ncbi:MAG TPA: PQQ-dependent sugar dehydrogenase [Allosphingosinicella sp.]